MDKGENPEEEVLGGRMGQDQERSSKREEPERSQDKDFDSSSGTRKEAENNEWEGAILSLSASSGSQFTPEDEPDCPGLALIQSNKTTTGSPTTSTSTQQLPKKIKNDLRLDFFSQNSESDIVLSLSFKGSQTLDTDIILNSSHSNNNSKIQKETQSKNSRSPLSQEKNLNICQEFHLSFNNKSNFTYQKNHQKLVETRQTEESHGEGCVELHGRDSDINNQKNHPDFILESVGKEDAQDHELEEEFDRAEEEEIESLGSTPEEDDHDDIFRRSVMFGMFNFINQQQNMRSNSLINQIIRRKRMALGLSQPQHYHQNTCSMIRPVRKLPNKHPRNQHNPRRTRRPHERQARYRNHMFFQMGDLYDSNLRVNLYIPRRKLQNVDSFGELLQNGAKLPNHWVHNPQCRMHK